MNDLVSTFDQILASARGLIVTGGYNGFSYADIAEEIGIRKASIHHHFQGKADLVCVLVTRYRQEAEKGLTELERNVIDPLELLKAHAAYWTRCIGDGSAPLCTCALLASELPALPPDVAREVRAYFRFLSDWLTRVMERGAETGRLTLSSGARIEAEAFMALIHGAMLSARAHGSPGIFGIILAPTLERLSGQSCG